jgi:hypothetical protein
MHWEEVSCDLLFFTTNLKTDVFISCMPVLTDAQTAILLLQTLEVAII